MINPFRRAGSGYLQRLNLLFFAFNFIYFSGTCVYFGFLVMYLSSKGFSSFECGIVNTVLGLCTLLFQPIAGYITDTFLTVRKYLIVASIGTIATTFLLPVLIEQSLLIVLLAIVPVALFSQPATFLADTWAVTLREQYEYLDYGKNRAGGSLGYSVMSALSGLFIAQWGYNSLFILNVIFSGLLILIVLQIPDIPCKNKRKQATEHKEHHEKSLSFGQVLKVLLKIKPFVVFILCAAFFSLGMRAMFSNNTFKLLEIGGGDSELGIALSLGAVFEVPVLLAITLACRRFKLNTLYICCLVFQILRGITYVAAQTPEVFYLSQALQALSYGTFVAVSLEIVSKLVPNHVRATAVTLMISMTSGFGGIAGSFLGGLMVEQMGAGNMAFWMTAIVCLSLVVYVVYSLYLNRKHPEQFV